MRILVTGANGFIGSQIVATLRDAGHQIVCAVRNKNKAQAQFEGCEIITCDFNRDFTVDHWIPRLKNIDRVINCVGILQEKHGESIKAIHELTPKALFEACSKVGVGRVIQISALGADIEAGTPYATTKNAAEHHLMQSDIDWVILRPSMVYAEGSYGGTSLFRGLAALPFIIPVIGNGQQYFQPIHLQDLAEAIKRLVEKPEKIRKKLDVVGAEPISYAQILIVFRRWLNFGKARLLFLPLIFAKIAAKISDWFGVGPLNSTALKMLMYGNTTTPEHYQELIQTIGFTPKGFTAGLMAKPSHVQDRWHAQLFFLQPLLRLSLVILWLGSGAISLLPPYSKYEFLLTQLGLKGDLQIIAFFSVALLDVVLGLALLLNWRTRLIATLQFFLIFIYTVVFSFLMPMLWVAPFGPLLKNIPLMVATLVMIAIAEDR